MRLARKKKQLQDITVRGKDINMRGQDINMRGQHINVRGDPYTHTEERRGDQ